ncbi:MAG: S1C family serine protease [Clostridiales bacterium]|nr:S1C family serine protease [Clostridiales bacterium]
MKKRLFTLLLAAALLLCAKPALGDYSFSADADAIEKAADSVFMLEVYSYNNRMLATGSGFVAFDSSLLVTNYHVIEGGSYVIAISDDLDEYLVSGVCGYDKNRDIALLRFDKTTNVAPLPLDTDGNLKRSQTVVAIGSPAGLRNTISIGNISGFYKNSGKDWIQFTAPISSGSSGGALFNDEGEIIGITTATYASAQNVNMAVKVEEAIRLYNKWDKKTVAKMGNMKGYSYPTASQQKDAKEGTIVWVSGGGKKYHNNPNCSKMRSPVQMDLMDAIEQGYEPCGKCYK